MTILKNSVAKGASDTELEYCLTVARRYRLDPFKQQIWFVKRWDSGADNGAGGKGAHVWTPQVGINGLLFAAARDHKKDFGSVSVPEYGPMEEQEFTTEKGKVVKFQAPQWAKVKMWKRGESEPTEAQAWWDEYAPADLSKAPFWLKMPRRMIAKCATALATRQAYPDLGGIYIPEECERMEQEFNQNVTPGGRQIIEGGGHGSHAAAQRVLQEKLEGKRPINPEIVDPEPPAKSPAPSGKLPESAYNPENVPAPVPAGPWKYAGTITLDYSLDKTFPRVTGDIAELAAHFPKDLTLKRKDDFWHCFSDDADRIKAVAVEKNFKIQEILPQRTRSGPEQRHDTTATSHAKGGRGDSAPAPAGVVSCTIERVNTGMAGKSPVKHVTVLLADRTKPTFSCFDKKWFERLDAGLGKFARLLTKQNGKYTNITGALQIGSHEWLEDGTPVIQNKDREAGGKTLF